MWSTLYSLLLGDATPEERTRAWRLILTLAFIIHTTYVYGWFPSVSLGFASVESVVQLQDAVNSIQVKQLLDGIEEEQRNVCNHLKENNTAALNYAVKKRDELIREYRAVTNHSVEPAACVELGISIDESGENS